MTNHDNQSGWVAVDGARPIYDNDDPIPARTAPATEIYDWHLARSLAAGIDIYDAEILADSFVSRYAR
jgi:hypothetical protein